MRIGASRYAPEDWSQLVELVTDELTSRARNISPHGIRSVEAGPPVHASSIAGFPLASGISNTGGRGSGSGDQGPNSATALLGLGVDRLTDDVCVDGDEPCDSEPDEE